MGDVAPHVIPNRPQEGELMEPPIRAYVFPVDDSRDERLARMGAIKDRVTGIAGHRDSRVTAEGVRLVFTEVDYLNGALGVVMNAERAVRERYRALNLRYGAANRRIIEYRAANSEMGEANARQADRIRELERAAAENVYTRPIQLTGVDASLLERAEQAEARLAELDTAHAARLEEVLRLRETARRHASEAATARMDAEQARRSLAQAEERGYHFKVRAERAEASLDRLSHDFPGRIPGRIEAPNYFQQAQQAGRVHVETPIFGRLVDESPDAVMFIQRRDDPSVFVEVDENTGLNIPQWLVDILRDMAQEATGIRATDEQVIAVIQMAEVTRPGSLQNFADIMEGDTHPDNCPDCAEIERLFGVLRAQAARNRGGAEAAPAAPGDAARFWARLDSGEFLGEPQALPGGVVPGMTGEETLTLQQGSRILLLGRVAEGEYRPFRTDVEYPFPLDSLVKSGLPCFPQVESYISSMRAADRLGLRFVCVGGPQD